MAHTGAMIALVPTDADAQRLAVDDGELADELHLTLFYLGDAVDIDDETRANITNAVRSMVERGGVEFSRARAFGAAHWNPEGDDPAWVLNVGDDRDVEGDPLSVVRSRIGDEAFHDGSVQFTMPDQHTPWQPHICLAYSSDDRYADVASRVGPIEFDRVRVAFGGQATDIPLTASTATLTSMGGVTVPWHKVRNHSECASSEPIAVVKDDTGEVEGCHANEAAADAQLAALYASESDASNDVEHFGSSNTISEASWDGSTSRFTDEQYQRASAGCDSGDGPPKSRCFLPHHEPTGALNRNALYNAAARFNQLSGHDADVVSRARSHLAAHYRAIGEEVPDVLSATDDVTSFQDESKGDDCPTGYHKMPDGSCMSDQDMQAASRWEGVLAVEGITTGDGREFAPNALTWSDMSLLRWQKEGSHGGNHDVTVSVGRIDETWRDGNQILGRGQLDLLNPDGFEVWRRLKNDFAGGISIDADDISDADVEFVWPESSTENEDESEGDIILSLLFGSPEKMIFHAGRVRAATLVDIPAFVEARIGLSSRVESGDVTFATPNVAAAATRVVAPHNTDTSDGLWDEALYDRRLGSTLSRRAANAAYAWIDHVDGKTKQVNCQFLHHEIDDVGKPGAANLTACATGIGLLNGARGGVDVPLAEMRGIYEHLAQHLRDAGREPPPAQFETESVTAALVDELRPPLEWFADPKLSVPTGITVTDQGRVYGHAAQWGECHVGFQDLCVTPPFEDVHPYFMTGEVICADGTRVAVGQITVGTGHAPLTYRATRAVEHYDNTGVAVADVAVGNDAHGIWVAGAIRPSVAASRVHELRASGQVSGDWRRIGGELRLVGLLAVNVPGFPVPRLRARVASGAPVALVAAGQTSVGRVPIQTDEELDRQAMRRVMRVLSQRMMNNKEEDDSGLSLS